MASAVMLDRPSAPDTARGGAWVAAWGQVAGGLGGVESTVIWFPRPRLLFLPLLQQSPSGSQPLLERAGCGHGVGQLQEHRNGCVALLAVDDAVGDLLRRCCWSCWIGTTRITMVRGDAVRGNPSLIRANSLSMW